MIYALQEWKSRAVIRTKTYSFRSFLRFIVLSLSSQLYLNGFIWKISVYPIENPVPLCRRLIFGFFFGEPFGTRAVMRRATNLKIFRKNRDGRARIFFHFERASYRKPLKNRHPVHETNARVTSLTSHTIGPLPSRRRPFWRKSCAR